jgi:hypothetical protein
VTFTAQPPDLHSGSLADGASRPSARSPPHHHASYPIPVRRLAVAPRFFQRLPRGSSPCASLVLDPACSHRGLSPPSHASCWEVAPDVFTSGASKPATFAIVPRQMNHGRGTDLDVGYRVTIESLGKLHRYPAGSSGHDGFFLPGSRRSCCPAVRTLSCSDSCRLKTSP